MSTELDITDFFNQASPMDYSASVMEVGHDAGKQTWRAALEDSDGYPLLTTDEDREDFRRYIRGFGAWDADEIAAMTNRELNALCIQMVSGDIREGDLDPDSDADSWKAYRQRSEDGEVSGALYKENDRIYYSIAE